MTDFWNRLGIDDGGMPVHLPMGVNADGQGPEQYVTADHFICWCYTNCPLNYALSLAHTAGVSAFVARQVQVYEQRAVDAIDEDIALAIEAFGVARETFYG